MRSKFPKENVFTLRSKASNVLKRSSGLKGGVAYKAKKKLVTSTSTSDAANDTGVADAELDSD